MQQFELEAVDEDVCEDVCEDGLRVQWIISIICEGMEWSITMLALKLSLKICIHAHGGAHEGAFFIVGDHLVRDGICCGSFLFFLLYSCTYRSYLG